MPQTRPKKYLGQNFLVDSNIKDRIIDSCDLQKEETVVEIGPGHGALTRDLSERVDRVIAIEADKELAAKLRDEFKDTNVTVINEDFLKTPLNDLSDNLKVVSNLPYNTATPIIEKIITHRAKFTSMYVTLQLEHANRLLAKINTRDYGSLSCFVQFYTEGKKLFNIRNTAFKPVPKVTSCFIRLAIRPSSAFNVSDEAFLFKLIRQGFTHRRKTLINSLEALIKKERAQEILLALKINPKARAENLSLNDYVRFVDMYKAG